MPPRSELQVRFRASADPGGPGGQFRVSARSAAGAGLTTGRAISTGWAPAPLRTSSWNQPGPLGKATPLP